MLHIIGIILKIIGILLAAGLGLLILLIGIVLLVPVRYEISAEFPGIEKVRESTVQAGCSWLLHLISVRFSYEEEKPDWRVRIAWKVFREESEEEKAEKEKKAHERRRKKKDSEKRKRRKKRNSGKRDRASENAAVTETKQQEAEKALTDHGKEKVQSEESGEMNTPRSGTQTEPAVPDVSVSETKEEAEKESLWEKASEKISTLFEKIKYTFRMICDKIKVVCETKEKVMDFLENEVHRTAYSKAVKELVWLKRFLKPKKSVQICILDLKTHIIPDLPLRGAV